VYTLDPRRVLALSGGMVTLARYRDVVSVSSPSCTARVDGGSLALGPD
jgi:hypothetical protein